MAEQHQDLYAEVYERQVAEARAQDPDASTTKIRNRARSRTLGELARRFPGDYRQRYATELARAHAELAQAAARAEQPAPPTPHVPYWQERNAAAELRGHDAARLRALLWLARLYPDTTARIYHAQAARLPLNPADRTPTRRRALAWARTLDRLARLHPDDFEARYRAELARTAEGHRRGAGHAPALVERAVAIT